MKWTLPFVLVMLSVASCGEDNACSEKKNLECMFEHGQFCEKGKCVDPWKYGSPQWSRCPDDPHATAESLFEKMEYYEDIARRLSEAHEVLLAALESAEKG